MNSELEETPLETCGEGVSDHEEKQEDGLSKDNTTKLKLVDNKKCAEGELLGSVTTTNCPGVRTSARVIQKMRQDQIRPTTPPPEKKDIVKEEKGLLKTPIQNKSSQVVWSNIERNLFFDALNEFGRDFDSIANFINSKLKRKNSTDQGFKSKEQVRQTFYQTFHKISKFIRFSDEVKKPAQELYALINYGEMRRRLAFVSEKNLMKIRDLIYKGHATFRSKGKTVRIKTPSCKALRKLNQLEDWLEDIKLPTKVEVCLRPATMESWGRIQSLAQNPVVRTVVPLQKKLSSVIRTFQYRWRSHEAKINEEALKLIGSGLSSDPLKCETQVSVENETLNFPEPLLRFTPNQDAIIHRPLVSITEYLSSFNICLNAYEERIGVKIGGEMLCHEKHSAKRQRSDSGCEKKSPEHKKFRVEQERLTECDITAEKEGKELKFHSNDVGNCDALSDMRDEQVLEDKIYPLERQNSADLDYIKNDLFDGENQKLTIPSIKDASSPDSTSKNPEALNRASDGQKQQKKRDVKCPARKKDKKDLSNLRPLISDNVVKQIRKGWTILNCGDITVGDLYVAFGQDSKLMFEYNWVNNNKDLGECPSDGVPYSANNNDNDDNEIVKQIRQSSLGNKLKQLLFIAHLNENVRRKPCYCGHTCERTGRSMPGEEFIPRSYISNKTYTSSLSDNVLFRQPAAPFRRNALMVDSLRRASNGMKYKPTRFGTFGSKQIVVKRLLPVQNGGMPEIEVKTVQNHFTNIQRASESSTEDKNDDNFEEDDEDNDNDNDIEADDEDDEDDSPGNEYEISIKVSECSDSKANEIDLSSTTSDKNQYKEQISLPVSCSGNNNTDQPEVSEIIKENKTITSCKDDIIHQQGTSLDEVPDLSHLMELSLSSPLPISTVDESINDIINAIPPLSPMQIIRENSSDPKWFVDNLNEFSLTSFFGHLDEFNSHDGSEQHAEINMALNESSIDSRKFAEITASMQNEKKNV